jgi:hypothetical protein
LPMTYRVKQEGMADWALPEGLHERFASALAVRRPPRRAAHRRTRRDARARRNGRWRLARRCEEDVSANAPHARAQRHECGDQRVGAKDSVICSTPRPRAPGARRPPSVAQRNAHGQRRDQVAHARSSSPQPTTRRSSANAPQRVGVVPRKVAMRTRLGEGKHAPCWQPPSPPSFRTRNARSERRDLGRTRTSMTYGATRDDVSRHLLRRNDAPLIDDSRTCS